MKPGSAIALVALILGSLVQFSAAEETKTEVLFVQTAKGYSFADGKLTLTGISPTTLWFTDRPDRKVGHIVNEAFLSQWSEGDDSFANDPPNAAIAIVGSAQPPVVAELTNPQLQGDRLVYDVDVLDGSLAANGGEAALLIDSGGWCSVGKFYNPECW